MIFITAFAFLLLLSFCIELQEALEELPCWLEEASIEVDEVATAYYDNSEYDWGHNVKNYMDYE